MAVSAHDITFDLPPIVLGREWLSRSHRWTARNSAWGASCNRGGHGPSFRRWVWPLIGHLIGSFLVFVTLLVLTWALEFLLTWLNNHQPFSDEDLKVISKLKTSMLYFDAVLSASVLIFGAWTFLKGATR
jgi:hypothetical protein